MLRFFLALLLVGWSWAEGSRLSLTASASTPSSGPFPITVSVVVTNYAKEASPEGLLVLWMKPRISYGTRPATGYPNMWDPIRADKDLPSLQPGQQRTFFFDTPYFSSTQLIDRRGSFRVNNLGPTLFTETQVEFGVQVEGQAAPPGK
jgi:hypothetical protein